VRKRSSPLSNSKKFNSYIADELLAQGNLALVQAFDGFGPHVSVPFSHYARSCISHAIVRCSAGSLSVVDIPFGKGRKVKQDIGIAPFEDNAAGYLNIDSLTTAGIREVAPDPLSGDSKARRSASFWEPRLLKGVRRGPRLPGSTSQSGRHRDRIQVR
jgi:hypothetical protein